MYSHTEGVKDDCYKMFCNEVDDPGLRGNLPSVDLAFSTPTSGHHKTNQNINRLVGLSYKHICEIYCNEAFFQR